MTKKDLEKRIKKLEERVRDLERKLEYPIKITVPRNLSGDVPIIEIVDILSVLSSLLKHLKLTPYIKQTGRVYFKKGRQK